MPFNLLINSTNVNQLGRREDIDNRRLIGRPWHRQLVGSATRNSLPHHWRRKYVTPGPIANQQEAACLKNSTRPSQSFEKVTADTRCLQCGGNPDLNLTGTLSSEADLSWGDMTVPRH